MDNALCFTLSHFVLSSTHRSRPRLFQFPLTNFLASSAVAVHPRFTREPLVTQRTLIRFLSRMDADVNPQVTFDFEGSVAEWTSKGPLSSMRSNVVFQTVFLAKALLAFRIRTRIGLSPRSHYTHTRRHCSCITLCIIGIVRSRKGRHCHRIASTYTRCGCSGLNGTHTAHHDVGRYLRCHQCIQ